MKQAKQKERFNQLSLYWVVLFSIFYIVGCGAEDSNLIDESVPLTAELAESYGIDLNEINHSIDQSEGKPLPANWKVEYYKVQLYFWGNPGDYQYQFRFGGYMINTKTKQRITDLDICQRLPLRLLLRSKNSSMEVEHEWGHGCELLGELAFSAEFATYYFDFASYFAKELIHQESVLPMRR